MNERLPVTIHAVVRIDQVEKRGAAKITAVGESTDKVRSLPSPLFVPGKRES